MRRVAARAALTLALSLAPLVAACGGGGNSHPKVQNQFITPCIGGITPTAGTPGALTPTPVTTPTIVPAFDVWQAIFAPPTARFTATPVPTSRTPGAATFTPPPTATPNDNVLNVSVNTIDAGTATQFRLTVACQGTVVTPATSCGLSCAFPPPLTDTDPCMESSPDRRCPTTTVDLNQFGFGDLRRLGCLVEIGPGEPLGFGACSDPNRAGYKLTITLNNQAAQSLTLAAHNCRAPESCLQDAFGIQIPPTPTATPS